MQKGCLNRSSKTTFAKVQVHITRLETKLALKKRVTCECDGLTKTMFLDLIHDL